MKNMMTIDGQQAVITYDADIEMFRGEFVGLNGGADFYAADVAGLHREGKISLAAFMDECAKRGIEPRKSFSGKFVLRVSPEIHEAAAIAAAARGESLNQWVASTIREAVLKTNGKPTFVVLPYDDYIELNETKKPTGRIPADDTTPHEVVSAHLRNGWSMIKAWREHLGLTQAEMAARLEIRQPSYAAMEAPEAKPKKATRERIAVALGVSLEQLS